MLRCALLEYNDHHDHILPSWVEYLNRLGYIVDIYTTPANISRNALAAAPGARARYLSMWNVWSTRRRRKRGIQIDLFRLREILGLFRGYDLVWFNTLRGGSGVRGTDRAVRTTKLRGLPSWIMITHDISPEEGNQPFMKFISAHREHCCVLSPHLSQRSGLPWAVPLSFGQVSEPSSMDFCVSGRLALRGRDYLGLAEAVAGLHERGIECAVRIVGNSDSEDGAAFRSELRRLQVLDRFRFTPPNIGHAEYLRQVSECMFVLPLINRRQQAGAVGRIEKYYWFSITSSIPMAIAQGRILVLEDELAHAYGIESCCITYPINELRLGLEKTARLKDAERSRLLQAVKRLRTRWYEQSLENIRTMQERTLKAR